MPELELLREAALLDVAERRLLLKASAHPSTLLELARKARFVADDEQMSTAMERKLSRCVTFMVACGLLSTAPKGRTPGYVVTGRGEDVATVVFETMCPPTKKLKRRQS